MTSRRDDALAPPRPLVDGAIAGRIRIVPDALMAPATVASRRSSRRCQMLDLNGKPKKMTVARDRAPRRARAQTRASRASIDDDAAKRVRRETPACASSRWSSLRAASVLLARAILPFREKEPSE